MATLLVPETYATINLAITAAAGIAAPPHTISVAAGTRTESISLASAADVSVIEGRTGNRADVIIEDNTVGTTVVSLGGGVTMRHLTISDTRAAFNPSTTAGNYAFNNLTGGSVLINCHIKSGGGGYYTNTTGGVIAACHIENTEKSTAQSTWGVFTLGSSDTLIYSSLIQDWTHANIYMYTVGTVVNCTVQTSYRKNASMRGIYCGTIINCIAHNNSGLSCHSGLTAATPITNSISYDWDGTGAADTKDYTGATPATCFASSTVVTPIFVDEAADDFNIVDTGSAYQNGSYAYQTTNGAPLNDLVGNAYDVTTPAIGCYEFVSAGGGPTNSVIKSMGGGFLSSPFSLTP